MDKNFGNDVPGDRLVKLQEMLNTLMVAICKALSKIELAHWAFHARVGGFDMIYQVIGGDGEPFEYDEKPCYPERSGSHSSNVAVSSNITNQRHWRDEEGLERNQHQQRGPFLQLSAVGFGWPQKFAVERGNH